MARIRASRRDLVLDVGAGHSPHSTADILVDRFIEDIQCHRSRKELVTDRPFVCADILALPFKERTFDYVICNQVLEHVADPPLALEEIARVGKRGFLAVPSEFQEFICPTPSHRWVFALKGGVLLIKPKQERHELGLRMYGGVFHMLYGHADFRRLAIRRPYLFAVRLEWEGTIPHRLFDRDEPFYDYHDSQDVLELLQPVKPDSLEEAIKQWLQISLSGYYSLTKFRGRVRRLSKGRL